ncbi:MAG: hypothetical protein D6722_02265 [Bacteroidetes bacterium]|nr:MAG: hypothetical protein D6722_02265 [Bacteroidota bacterium]
MQLFLLFSHRLTAEQQADAESSLGVTDIRYLPEDLQARWSQVPPEPESVRPFAQPIWDWLAAEAQPGDYVMVQGDFGMSYATVQEALRLGLIPVYATTRRESSEVVTQDGQVKKTLTFKHVRFRRYGA